MTLRQRLASWRQPKPHAETGDLLTPSERLTWHVIGIYRRWSVFLALQVITFIWWTWPRLFPGGQFGWNLAWSALAVDVEMLVGIAFFGQSIRDARIIRSELRVMREEQKLIRAIAFHLGVPVPDTDASTPPAGRSVPSRPARPDGS